jgi:hypothetical protein
LSLSLSSLRARLASSGNPSSGLGSKSQIRSISEFVSSVGVFEFILLFRFKPSAFFAAGVYVITFAMRITENNSLNAISGDKVCDFWVHWRTAFLE